MKIYQKKFPNYLPWHAHITCLTVAPAARRLGHATRLSEALEQVGDEQNAWFVDLFVRVENEAAIKLYKKMGWVVLQPWSLSGSYSDLDATGIPSTEGSPITTTTEAMLSTCGSR